MLCCCLPWWVPGLLMFCGFALMVTWCTTSYLHLWFGVFRRHDFLWRVFLVCYSSTFEWKREAIQDCSTQRDRSHVMVQNIYIYIYIRMCVCVYIMRQTNVSPLSVWTQCLSGNLTCPNRWSSLKPPTMENKRPKETHEAPEDLPLSMKLGVVSFWYILMVLSFLEMYSIAAKGSMEHHLTSLCLTFCDPKLPVPALTKRHAFTGSTNSQPASRQAERKTWVMRQERSRLLWGAWDKKRSYLVILKASPNFSTQLSIISQE